MNNEVLITPIAAFLQHAENNPNKIFLRQSINGDVVEYSFADAEFEIKAVAARLAELPPKSHIAIISLNCAHWVMADLAIMLSGHISIPIYPTASTSTVAQILEHSASRLIFVGKMPDWGTKKYLIPGEVETISMHTEHQGMESWSGIIERFSALDEYPEIQMDDLLTIAYTSGTTGMPKGVMTSYRSISQAGKIIMSWIDLDQNDRFFSYLPLAHVAERAAVEMAALYSGGMVSFAESLETFTHDLKQARVTVFLGVPRIWVKFQQAVEQKIPTSLLKILLKIPFVGKRLKNKLLQGLGLEDVKFAISGAAALPRDTLDWFDNIGLPICEAYGMTETFAISNLNHPDFRRPGSVGKVLPGFEVKIADDDEILFKNPCLMKGYYREPELTSQAYTGEYLHSGDTGKIDEDGFLWITGRVKDLFKTTKGKYISPVKIEMELEPRAMLDNVCVMGSNLNQPVVLGSIANKPDAESLKSFEARLKRIMDEVNGRLESTERLAKWFLVEESWTPENDMITPTLKMRRQSIENKYMPQINSLISDSREIIWLDA